MQTWEDVKGKRANLQREAFVDLTAEQRDILLKVLELEADNRHLKTPEIKKPLHSFVKQVIK